MTATLELRPAVEADAAGIRQLMSSVMGWGKDHETERLWRWKHEDNPFGRSPVWLAEDAGRVVALRVFLRWTFARPDGRTANCVRAVDTVTHPDYRGRGLFRRLTLEAIPHLADEGVDFIFNTPNDQSRPGYISMGWVPVGRLPLSMWCGRPSGWWALFQSRVPAELTSLVSEAGVPAAEGLDGDVMACLRRSASPGLGTHRTGAFLRWRYTGLPTLGYRVVSLEGDAGGGVAVVRLRRRGDAIEATVAESYAPSRRARLALMAKVVGVTGATYAASLPVGSGARGVPAGRRGPLLTARIISSSPPPVRDWSLSLGDIELF